MRILVPVDSSDHSAHAIDFILTRSTLIGHAPEIRLLTVVPEGKEDEGGELLAPVASRLAEAGIQAKQAVAMGDPADRIAERAEDDAVDLVVMGSHGRTSLQGLIMGSVTTGVLSKCGRPLLVVRNRPAPVGDALRVGVAVDGSKYGRAAVRYLVHNKDLFGADPEVFLINVTSGYVGAMLPDMAGMALPALSEEEIAEQRKIEFHTAVDPLMPLLESVGIRPKGVLLAGNPGDEIAAFARRENLDLVVMGSRGYGRFKSAVLGSTATRIASRDDVPLLIIRHP